MTQRNKQLDAARGLLILLMLIGHAWTDGWFRSFIYAFHMPAFFVLSGLLLRHSASLEKPLWQIALKKARTMLVPYVFFELFSIAQKVIQHGAELNLKGYLFQALTLHLTNGPLWFLIVLFCAEMLFVLFWKLKRPAILAIVGSVLFGLCIFLPKSAAFISPVMIFTALVFLIFGYFAHALLLKPSAWLGFGALVLTAVLAAVNPVEINSYQDGIPGLYFLSGIAGAAFILQLSRYCQWKPLIFWGQNSLIVLGTHYPLLRAALWLLRLEQNGFWTCFLLFSILLVLEIPLIFLINRCMPFVLGRWYSRPGMRTPSIQPLQAEGPGPDREENPVRDPKTAKKKRAFRLRCFLFALSVLLLLSLIELFLSNNVLTVSRYTVSSPKILHPIRVVFLGDVHGREFGDENKRLLDAVRAEEPDLIAVVGDVFNQEASTEEIDAMCSLLRNMTTIAPVYFCPGNHEFLYCQSHGTGLIDQIRETGAIYLDSTYLDVTVNHTPLRIGGYMGYYRQPGMFPISVEQQEADFAFSDAFESTDRFKLLLDHVPTGWLDWKYQDKYPVDLVLTAHYHGGVVRIPFLEQGLAAPYVGWFPPYTKGLFEGREAVCILTTGLAGYGRIPRFFNPPEICVAELIPE